MKATNGVDYAHRLDVRDTLDVMGPKVEFFSLPTEDDNDCGLMRGTIPPGGLIPLHSRADPETFIVVSGEAEALSKTPEGLAWMALGPGDVFHVPNGAPHAFRNRGPMPATMIIASTSKIGRFFREVGTPAGQRAPGPSADRVEQFMRTAARYGYRNATPEENARFGIMLTPPA